MNPENKNFVLAMIDKFPVSVRTLDDATMYHMELPDGRPLAICADVTTFDSSFAVIYYTISIGDDILEEAVVDTSKKNIDPVAKDIIQIMRACSTKIMMQEAHLTHSRFMVHLVSNNKTMS